MLIEVVLHIDPTYLRYELVPDSVPRLPLLSFHLSSPGGRNRYPRRAYAGPTDHQRSQSCDSALDCDE